MTNWDMKFVRVIQSLLKSCTRQQYHMFGVQFYPCQLKVIRILNFVRRPVVFSLLSNLSNLFAQE